MFFLFEINGGSINMEMLVVFGVKENSLIVVGEWWWFLILIVFYIGIVYLVFNMFVLWLVGIVVEWMYGLGRFLLIYLVVGIIGLIVSFVFSLYFLVGVLGVIFGCLGVLLYIVLLNWKMFLRIIGINIIVIIIINFGFGFVVLNIDNLGYIGGLIGGFFVVVVFGLFKVGVWGKRVLLVVLLIVLVVGFLYYGLYLFFCQELVLI